MALPCSRNVKCMQFCACLAGVAAIGADVVQGPGQRGGHLRHHVGRARLGVQRVGRHAGQDARLRQPHRHRRVVPALACTAEGSGLESEFNPGPAHRHERKVLALAAIEYGLELNT